MKLPIIDFKKFLSSALNPEQLKAVKHDTGSLLVVAGAGSGKTRVITARICNLILNKDVAPSSIVALTFTNKAAREMKERIVQFLGKDANMPYIGTFHSYCLRLLKINAHLLEHPIFVIMDSDDQEKLITRIIKETNVTKKVSAKSLTYTISQIKTSRIIGKDHEVFDPFISSVFEKYEREKKASHCFDFDDLLLEVLKLFQKNKEFKAKFQRQIQHLMVDEYQDTNAVQHALLKLMTLKTKKTLGIDSICVVGDEDQSIYSWRGATVENILSFKKDFSNTKMVTIEQNYRSVKQILTIANSVISHNKKRNPKKLWSDKPGKNRAVLLTTLSGYQESDAIAAAVHVAQKNEAINSMAVLYRTHFQSRVLEEAFLRSSIPYKIIGGIQFYARKEIKDLLAYIRLIVNPFDRISLARVINTPNRGLGDKFQEIFFTQWDQEPLMNCKELGEKLVKEKIVTKTRAAALKGVLGLFTSQLVNQQPTKLLDTILARSKYIDFLKTKYDKQEAEAKIDNVKELLRAFSHFEQTGIGTAAAILDEIALMQEKMEKNKDNEQCVQLMTLHAAKGLEFDMVMLTGLEEALLPSSRSLHDSDAVEEERRLFYVGITRARERLIITHSKFRHTYGNMTEQLPSRFIDEIPGHLVQHEDCAYWKSYNFIRFFNTWMGTQATKAAPITFGAQTAFRKSSTGKLTRPEQKNKKIFKSILKSKFGSARKTTTGPRFGSGTWRKNQPVKHTSFGIGIIETVEKKGADKFYITARFKTGIKKLDSKFLKKI